MSRANSVCCLQINLFVAVIVENFSVAEDEMMERQRLTYEKKIIPPPPGNALRKLFVKLGAPSSTPLLHV